MAAKTKAKGRQLKVYWAEIDGLNDWVVAAPNRAEALKAFGVHQDLFAQGDAGDSSNAAAIDAARAQPLTPLRRPKGSGQPFAPATGFTDWSAAIPKAAPGRAPSKTKAKAPPEKPRPDRGPLDRAKAELEALETRRRDALKRLAEDRARLDDRRARLEADFALEISGARRAVEAAERAYRAAGGA